MPDILKEAALEYIQAGFSVIPLKPREKLPLIKWSRFQKKRPTEKEVTTWWTKWPDANVALLTGRINNLIAFDEDGPEAEQIIKENGGLPPGPQSITKNGRHYLFKHPGFSVRNDVNRKLALDIRGDGGYIVVPPSVHPSGFIYEWASGLSLLETDLPDLRAWQVEYLKKSCEVGQDRNPPGWQKESLKGVAKGNRNDTATKLAGHYIRKGLSDGEIAPILLEWNKLNEPPLPRAELLNILTSIRAKDSEEQKKAKKEPTELRSPFDTGTGSDLVPSNISLESIGPSDFFEEKRFVPQFLAKYLELRFKPLVFDGGEFYSYNSSGVWKAIEPNLLGQVGEKVLDKYTKTARLQDGVNILRERAFIPPQKFKHNSDFLNLKNGMLEIATVGLEKHGSEYFSRIQLDVSLNKEASCPRWEKFLEEIFPGAPEKAKTLQAFLGYCLLPDCRHQRCLFMIGSGANGKSVVVDTLVSILGEENVCSLPLQLMGQRFLVGQLKDKLVNVASELATNQVMDTSNFKDAVTGGLLMADQKHGKPFAFYPIAKHIFSMNEVPKLTDKSYGFQRRPIVLTFTERFEGERRDPHLTKRLIEEKDGIFLWMLEGLMMVLEKDDLFIPEAVERDTIQFVKSTNPVLLFVEECCILGDEYHVKPGALYEGYKEWCKEGGNRPLSRNRFYDQILIHFPSVEKKAVGENRNRMYTGVGLLEQ